MKNYLLLFIVLLFISCAGPKVTIAFEGSSQSSYSASEEGSKLQKSESSEPEQRVVVWHIPELKKGQKALKKQLHYPQEAVQDSIEGRVIVQFIIDENGNPTEIKLLKGIGHGCDEVVLNAVQNVEYINESGSRFLWELGVDFKL